jgi:type IV secretion system protein VirB6
MASTIFQTLESKLETPIRDFVESGAGELVSAVQGPLRVAVMLYIVLYGILILRGVVQTPLMDSVWRSVKIAVIIALATQAGEYNQYVTNVFFETLPTEIGNKLAGGGSLTANTFDTFMQRGWARGAEIWEQAGLTNPGPALVAVMVFIAATIGTTIAFCIMMYAKVALAVVLALGPIFVALALFEPTRKFTNAWIGSLVNFVILQSLVYSLLLLIMKISDQTATTVSGGSVIEAALVFVVIYTLAGILTLCLPFIASGLAAGGAALSLATGTAVADKIGSYSLRGTRSAASKSAGTIAKASDARWASATTAAAKAAK